MNKEGLRDFLIASNKAGYASGQEKRWVKEADGSTSICYEQGAWRSHDNFFGGELYGGRLIVFESERPYWIMVYYGWVEPTAETSLVYTFLRKALRQMPHEAPYRGPHKYNEGGYLYSNQWSGDLLNYWGEEGIIQSGNLIYQAFYRGGLIDQRAGV